MSTQQTNRGRYSNENEERDENGRFESQGNAQRGNQASSNSGRQNERYNQPSGSHRQANQDRDERGRLESQSDSQRGNQSSQSNRNQEQEDKDHIDNQTEEAQRAYSGSSDWDDTQEYDRPGGMPPAQEQNRERNDEDFRRFENQSSSQPGRKRQSHDERGSSSRSSRR